MMILMFEHKHNVHIRGNEGGGGEGGITKISYFCEHYNGLLLYLISHCFLLLDFFHEVIL